MNIFWTNELYCFLNWLLLTEWMHVLYSELYCGILSTTVYCYCDRILCRFPRGTTTVYWLMAIITVRSFKTYCYCYANGCTTYDCLLYWTTEVLIELNCFHFCKDIHSKPLYALCYSLGFSSLLIYICRCTGTRPQLEASGLLQFCQANYRASLRGSKPILLRLRGVLGLPLLYRLTVLYRLNVYCTVT